MKGTGEEEEEEEPAVCTMQSQIETDVVKAGIIDREAASGEAEYTLAKICSKVSKDRLERAVQREPY